jgi:hypothetical protein
MEVTRELLHSLYWDDGLSVSEVAQRIDRSEETTRRLMIALGIPRKPRTWKFAGGNKGKPMSAEQRQALSETRKEMYASGALVHWNTGGSWSVDVRKRISESLLDGREPAPSDYGPDWRLQRTSCLQRDDGKCQQCGSSENVEVHHWEPYRFCYDNSLDNLVTLCESCHHEKHGEYREEGFTAEAEAAFYA